ncbi:T-complex theta subunit [Micractinium conductrix]|uniref:CCT-theta n=1 Tax=Micractinium conductrix TaxID=554055 RepID=A0A2P6VBN3_9CHLO|nr:T-complex theta subunit [Micractinium conductrix]|eukprot:PSC71471.1 T-complex theta subunit [Micractinium conductrix]
MAMGMPYGLQAMLKEGHKHLSGLEEAVMKNIEACKGLAQITRTSMGPNGMNKMVINHLEKLFVTSDASTIITELEVQHPAAKLLVMAAQAQQQEIGDGTNLVLSIAGELLGNAEVLLRDGLHPTEIADGYAKAGAKALEILDTLVLPGTDTLDVRDKAPVAQRIKGSVSSKQYGYEDLLAPLIAEACIDVVPKNPHNFNVDNVRVAKISGGGLHDSHVVKGMVLKRAPEGSVQRVADGKVAVFAQGVDASSTETKGTVLIRSAEELEGYSRGEEARIEEIIKSIADSGAKVVVGHQAFGEMALHFIEKYGLMALKIPSKFELRRFCRATGATALVKLQAPQADELGFARSLAVQEIGGTKCVVLQQDSSMGQISTVVLRGSTDQMLDDVERAVDDGVNSYKLLGKDARAVPAGGASEIEIARQLQQFGRKETGLDQYAIVRYAEALEVVPRTIAENSGLSATDAVAALYAAHAAGQQGAGLDVETGEAVDLGAREVYDLYATKWWALKLATEAAVTVLRIDQIIMAKMAGGPKPRGPGMDDED